MSQLATITEPKVWIAGTKPGDLAGHLRTALAWLDWERLVPSNARVWIKPNLTCFEHLPGVTVTPPFMAALAEVLQDRTPHVTFCESDGGYNAYAMETAFEAHGLYALRKRYGAAVVNLSRVPVREVSGEVNGKEVSVQLPIPLLDECDVFITVPVPKIHSNTIVSLAFKNQWGCLPDSMRLRDHPEFTPKVILINRVLRTRMAIFDGTFFLNRTGPIAGLPVRKDLLIASDDIGAASMVCCRIMGINDRKVEHLMAARRAGVYPNSLADVKCSQAPEAFLKERFYLRRSPIQVVAWAAFNSRVLTRIIYDSATADVLHRVLYAVRRNRFIGRLLYGETGPPVLAGRRSE